MNIPVLWWTTETAHPAEQWDAGFLHLLFEGQLGDTLFDFDVETVAYHPESNLLVESEFAVYIVAARHMSEDAQMISAQLQRHRGVILILLGDEEAAFPWREVKHPNIRFWVMTPNPVHHADMADWAYFFGTGCRVDTRMLLEGEEPRKTTPWAFMGQDTHPRRKQAVNGLRKAATRIAGVLEPTESFTAGRERPDYLSVLRDARIAPCPSGPQTADSMRLYEALEAGCLPIVDAGPLNGPLGFWEMLYGNDHPLIVTWDWESVGGIIEAELSAGRWPRNANIVSAWWQQTKVGMVRRLIDDLRGLGTVEPPHEWQDEVTVVITTSPVPSNPSTDMINATIDSIIHSMGQHIRVHFVIASDGVRPEQAHLTDDYNEFVRRLCWETNQQIDILPVVSREHRHQAGMMRLALEHVHTPVVLFAEHDTPLSDDKIDWPACVELMAYGALDVLRFHHEAQVHPEHERFNLGGVANMLDVPIQRTIQFSARPHLARADWYRRVLAEHFTPGGKSFIEDRMHSVCQVESPDQNRIAVYHPEGSIRRSLHTDGRESERKYAETQTW